MKRLKYIFFIFTFVLAACFLLPTLPILATSYAQEGADSYYLSENSNVDTIHATTVGTMPCIGDAKILVFYTDFKGQKSSLTKTKEEVEDLFFSEETKNDASLAYTDKDSVRSYYYRSSYGKLDITGSVFEYQAKNDITYYENLNMVLDEIIEHYKDSINWNEYDGNNDGYIDGIYVLSKQYHSWADANWVQGYSNTVGDKTFARACLLLNDDLSTICHETCHMFGLPDMYSKVNLNNGGLWTASIMDYGQGDLPSPAKFILGWLDNATFVDSSNVGSFNLRSYSNYGDVLIIYPNGDKTNRNWFFVEYVTKEGNNNNTDNFVNSPNKYGVRVWKTQMMLDEDYNVIGEEEQADGWIPSPFVFLESIHPDGIINTYMQVGEKITPYTYPSTAYSDTFYSENRDKFLKELTFSGINISFESVDDGIATVDVQIEKEADNTKNASGTIVSLPIDESSDFIDNKDLVCFAKLSSDVEFKSNERLGKITIKSESANIEYTLKTKLSINKRDVQLYITVDMLKELRKQTDWEISVTDLTTYYGTDVKVSNCDETFDFSEYPTPLIDNNEQFNTDFNMSLDKKVNTNFKYFKLSDSTILTIYFDDTVKKLYWGEINVDTNTTLKYELQLPEGLNLNNIWNIHTGNQPIPKWEDYGKYFVYIGNYVCCYSNRELISYYDVSNVNDNLIFKGSDKDSFFVDRYTRKIYEMKFNNNVISFETLAIDTSEIELNYIYNIYSFVDNQYVITTSKTVRFIDVEKNIIKDFANDNGKDFDFAALYFLEDNYYVFSSSVDLTMSRFDTEFDLVNDTCILKNLSSTMNELNSINVDYNNYSWIVYFECGSKLNPIGMNTYLLVCSRAGQVINYYKYYDSYDLRADTHIIPLSDNSFIGLEFSSFKYVRMGCDRHAYGDWTIDIAPTCTEGETERRDCNNCEYYQIKEVQALDHNYGDWTETLAPTCTEYGTERRDCYNCDCFETQDISMLGHNYGNWTETLAPTCTEYGTERKDCYNCDCFETQDISVLGHNYGDWTETLAPTCTEKGTEQRNCSRCEHFETKEILELGHSDADNDGTCDLCGWKESQGLSSGAIVGIVVGSTITVGAVGFSLFWFVIKKKRFSDLFKK